MKHLSGLDSGEDMADLGAFYGQQLPTWRKLLEALAIFDANREALVKDAKAGAALKELDALRDNASPYAQISRIDPLLAIVLAVNDALAGNKREQALPLHRKSTPQYQSATSPANRGGFTSAATPRLRP